MCLLLLNLKCIILSGVSLGNKKNCFFNQLFGCPKANFDLEWYAKQKKLYTQNDATASHLATNVRMFFKLCSMLITTLTSHASKN